MARAAVLTDGTSPATEFFESLQERFRDAYLYRFKKFADTGSLLAPRQLNSLGDRLIEFKLSEGPRIVGYYAGKREPGLVVMTHGFVKKSQRTPSGEIARAKAIRDEVEKR